MAGAFVQDWGVDSAGALVDTVTVTVGTNATAGNLLLCTTTVRFGGESYTEPTGWNEIYTTLVTDHSTAAYWRIATGTSSDDCVLVWTNTGKVGALVAEYSGLDATSPYEDHAITDADGWETDVASIGTGTATPASANGIAIAVLGVKDKQEWTTNNTFAGITIDSGFTSEDAYHYYSSSSNPITAVASKVYTSTAGQSATWTTSDNVSPAAGAMIVFKEPAVGGGGVAGPLMGGAMTDTLINGGLLS